eukprot:364023-Chlamydomonas_euryale.AAC.11
MGEQAHWEAWCTWARWAGQPSGVAGGSSFDVQEGAVPMCAGVRHWAGLSTGVAGGSSFDVHSFPRRDSEDCRLEKLKCGGAF